MVQWHSAVNKKLDKQSFYDLFANKIPYIAIDNFIAAEQCQRLIQAIRNLGLEQYDYNFEINDAPPANHLFETHYLYEQKTPEEYFPKALESIQQYQSLCKQIHFDPILQLQNWMRDHCQQAVTIAQQNQDFYSYVIIRELNNSALLHADFANFIPDYWSISKVVAQYAWNIYLTDPGVGGECVVYNRPWQRIDDQHIVKDTYGYDHCVVKNCDSVLIKPNAGKLVLFNSRNFHEVHKSERSRLSIGGHIGLLPNNEIIMWV